MRDWKHRIRDTERQPTNIWGRSRKHRHKMRIRGETLPSARRGRPLPLKEPGTKPTSITSRCFRAAPSPHVLLCALSRLPEHLSVSPGAPPALEKSCLHLNLRTQTFKHKSQSPGSWWKIKNSGVRALHYFLRMSIMFPQERQHSPRCFTVTFLVTLLTLLRPLQASDRCWVWPRIHTHRVGTLKKGQKV